MFSILGCKKKESHSISVSPTELDLKQSSNSILLTITTDAPQWNISSDVKWIYFSDSLGESGSTPIFVTALENDGQKSRTAILTISAGYAQSVQIYVNQQGGIYPSYNTSPIPPDTSGMSSTAMEIANHMTIGWNVGNSLESIGGETAWGNPPISQALINLVKESGFNSIRIPCSFNQYMENDSTAKLKTAWLDRVKQVVQYCINDHMYAILNIHWDGGWLENNCTLDKQEEVNAKQKAFWEQIATHLRSFDEHLLFAACNEPNVENTTQMEVLKSYEQTFIDAVRSTGGRNAYRVLVIQGPNADIQATYDLMKSLPIDTVPDRMMVEVHYYTPWNFCGMTQDQSWGKMFYYWGKGYHSTTDTTRNATYGEEETVDAMFAMVKDQFVNNGIPVVLGEYGALRRGSLTGENLKLHLASRDYYLYYVTKHAKDNGMVPFYWDNGYTTETSDAIFDRKDLTVFDQEGLDAILKAVKN